jgi:hypothetical protein
VSFWFRPTKPHTAFTPSNAAASIMRTTKSCFFSRSASSSWSRLSKRRCP